MRPILFRWRGVPIHSFPALLYLGLVSGIAAGNYVANRGELDSARVFVAMLALATVGLVGARLLFVATHWRIYRREPLRIWHRREGGASLQGGLVLSVLVSVPLLRAAGVPFAAFWDVATFTMLIGVVFTRVGCLLNGCCGGRSSAGPFRHIPLQLLEAIVAAVLLIGDVWFWSRQPFPGAIFLATVTAYQIFRFVFAPAREAREWIGRVDFQRTVAAGLGFLAAIGFLVARLIAS